MGDRDERASLRCPIRAGRETLGYLADHHFRGASGVYPNPVTELGRLRVDFPRSHGPVGWFPTAVSCDADTQRRLQREYVVRVIEASLQILDLGLPVEISIEHNRPALHQESFCPSDRYPVGSQELRETTLSPEAVVIENLVD